MTTPDPTRRDFLMVSAFSGLAVATGAAAWGLGRSMAPDAAVRERMKQVRMNLFEISEGREIVLKLYERPWTIRHRTKAEIESARAVAIRDLIDPIARNANLNPNDLATDENRAATPNGSFVVFSLVCTYHHLCVVSGGSSGGYAGWFCPCCGSHFDEAGRIRQGPAHQNLTIPRFEVGTDLVMTFHHTPPPDTLHYG
jgi:ubiquinol-cytochrome c reductase iron-sulfur subunit